MVKLLLTRFPLWFLLAVFFLVDGSPKYFNSGEEAELFQETCRQVRGLLPLPRNWFQKFLVTKILEKMDRELEALSILMAMGFMEQLIVDK